MMPPVLFERLKELLLPSGPSAWVARLLFWCCLAFLVHVGVKLAVGRPVELAWDLIVISLTIAPLFALAMMQAQNQDEDFWRIHRIAHTDNLTGLMNRRAFFDTVRLADDGALLMIDIDHFKAVNDRYGHAAGDAVLVAMADHLRRNLRSGDLLGRVGGEEFAAYLIGADSLEIDAIGARICKGFTLYNNDVPAPIKVTMSVGAAYSAMCDGTANLYKNADEALYAAKHSGRARLNFWQPVASKLR